MDKILKIQSEIGVLSKDKENPFFKSNYLDINSLLAQIQPVLDKHKIVVLQPLSNINGKPALRTLVLEEKPVFQTTENGIKQFPPIIDDVIPLPTETLEKLKDGTTIIRPLTSQEFGSAITYFRRYALQSLFLIQAQDDDGNHASGKKVGKLEDNEDPF